MESIGKHMKTTIETLWMILDLFEELGVTYWLDGGWGVDVLYGKQTREHRDIDINFDAAKTEVVLKALKALGYVLETDWLPIRAEFAHSQYGYLDIHPFVIGERFVKQANPEGGYWEFPQEYFGKAVFERRTIPCISLEGQKVFHSGYDPKEKDLHDMKILKQITKETM